MSYDVNAALDQTEGLNALAWALLWGRAEVVAALVEGGEAKLYVAEQQLRSRGQTVLGVICERGYIDLLEYYFPKFVDGKYLKPQTSSAADRFQQETLIQTASRYGQVEIIQYFVEAFKYRDPPREFSVHWIHEGTGYNCALLSVCSGKLEAVQYLHQKCGADFLLKTKRGESALSLARAHHVPLAVVQFLVDEVKVEAETTVMVGHESYFEGCRATHDQSQNGRWDWNAISPILQSEEHSECLDILALYSN